MEAGEYEAYAYELFGVAADALLVPPMQVPQILVSWEPPPACERAEKPRVDQVAEPHRIGSARRWEQQVA